MVYDKINFAYSWLMWRKIEESLVYFSVFAVNFEKI